MVVSVGTVLVTLPHQLLSNASRQSAASDRPRTRKQPDLLLDVGHARGGPCGRMQVRHVLQDALQGMSFGISVPSELSAFILYFKRAEIDKVVLQLSCGCRKCAVRTLVSPKHHRCMG